MPRMLKIGPNDNFKLSKDASPDEKAAWAKIKAERPKLVSYVSAMEAIRNSGNMYRTIIDDYPEPTEPGPRRLEDYTLDELKVMLISLGIKTEKQMKRDDVIGLIRRKLDEVEISDEGDDA